LRTKWRVLFTVFFLDPTAMKAVCSIVVIALCMFAIVNAGPLHASCKMTVVRGVSFFVEKYRDHPQTDFKISSIVRFCVSLQTFPSTQCDTVQQQYVHAFTVLSTTDCKDNTTEKCLHNLTSQAPGSLKGTHETPKAHVRF
jgi:hypothetical protein